MRSAWVGSGEGGIVAWLGAHEALVVWMSALSLGSLVLAAVLLPVFVVRLPADYFVTEPKDVADRRRSFGWLLRFLKNMVGAIFVLAGIAMLVLPGQGLLTMLIGMLLTDFPGKRRIELRIVRRPAILAFMNRLRERKGVPPLRVE